MIQLVIQKSPQGCGTVWIHNSTMLTGDSSLLAPLGEGAFLCVSVGTCVYHCLPVAVRDQPLVSYCLSGGLFIIENLAKSSFGSLLSLSLPTTAGALALWVSTPARGLSCFWGSGLGPHACTSRVLHTEPLLSPLHSSDFTFDGMFF